MSRQEATLEQTRNPARKSLRRDSAETPKCPMFSDELLRSQRLDKFLHKPFAFIVPCLHKSGRVRMAIHRGPTHTKLPAFSGKIAAFLSGSPKEHCFDLFALRVRTDRAFGFVAPLNYRRFDRAYERCSFACAWGTAETDATYFC